MGNSSSEVLPVHGQLVSERREGTGQNNEKDHEAEQSPSVGSVLLQVIPAKTGRRKGSSEPVASLGNGDNSHGYLLTRKPRSPSLDCHAISRASCDTSQERSGAARPKVQTRIWGSRPAPRG